MKSNDSLEKIADYIRENDNFTLIGHMIPDGDCIGSIISMYHCLQSMGKKCNMLLRDSVPENYQFLECADRIVNLNNLDSLNENIIYLDCSDMERSGSEVVELVQKKSPKYIINIDHHGTNDYFGNLNYVDASASATAEILFNFISILNCPVNSSLATSLYTALVMDTGNFQYSSTTSKTLKTAACLLDYGADINKIRIAMYESKDPRELRLLSLSLSHMQLSENRKIAWMYLTSEEAKLIHSEDFHPEGIVNYLRSIAGVEVAVFFREMNSSVTKIAFRSKNYVNVAEIASNFGGGGHNQAAGARFNGTLNEAIEKVIPYIEKVI